MRARICGTVLTVLSAVLDPRSRPEAAIVCLPELMQAWSINPNDLRIPHRSKRGQPVLSSVPSLGGSEPRREVGLLLAP